MELSGITGLPELPEGYRFRIALVPSVTIGVVHSYQVYIDRLVTKKYRSISQVENGSKSLQPRKTSGYLIVNRSWVFEFSKKNLFGTSGTMVGQEQLPGSGSYVMKRLTARRTTTL